MKVGEKMTKKIVMIIITMLFIIITANCNVYAALSSAVNNFTPDDWKPSSTTSVSGGSELKKIGNKIIGAIRVIGSIISVIALTVLGIKYTIGSVEEKAEYKKTMKPYIIGAVMVFAITNILGIIQDIVGGF